MHSLNNRLILEQYKKEEIKAKVVGGLAMMGHKLSLKPLKVLVDAKLLDGTLIPKGSIAYVREEYLHLNAAAGRHGDAVVSTITNEDIHPEPFIILDLAKIEIIDTPHEKLKAALNKESNS